MQSKLFVNFGNQNLSVVRGGSVGDDDIVVERSARLIGAQHVDQRYGVRGRLHIRHIEFSELLDIFEYLIELSLKQPRFLVGQLNPREIGDVRNIHMICICHGFLQKNMHYNQAAQPEQADTFPNIGNDERQSLLFFSMLGKMDTLNRKNPYEQNIKKFLEEMIHAISPSGYEHRAAAFWKADAEKHADSVETDVYGNSHALLNKGGKVEIDGRPVLTRDPNINPKLCNLIVKTAKAEKMPVQIVAEARGTGTDANAIELHRGGVATALVSIPLRHMHSPCELISLNDLEALSKLLTAVLKKITPRTSFIPF